MSTTTTGSTKVAQYRPNNRLGGSKKGDTDVWIYINDRDIDFHLDAFNKDGEYLGHVSFTVGKKDLRRG